MAYRMAPLKPRTDFERKVQAEEVAWRDGGGMAQGGSTWCMGRQGHAHGARVACGRGTCRVWEGHMWCVEDGATPMTPPGPRR